MLYHFSYTLTGDERIKWELAERKRKGGGSKDITVEINARREGGKVPSMVSRCTPHILSLEQCAIRVVPIL